MDGYDLGKHQFIQLELNDVRATWEAARPLVKDHITC
jgi:hypothetical protein